MAVRGLRGLGALVVALLLAVALFATPEQAEASKPPSWKFSVLHDFGYCTAPCQINVPSSGVMFGPGGSLLGTGCDGGTDSNAGGVYRLTRGATKWKAKTLGEFTGHDPLCPSTANLLLSRSSTPSGVGMPGGRTIYYGTSPGDGGDTSCGTVFELSHSGSGWQMTTIYSFQNDGDGCGPHGGVIEDAQGNLYGTTFDGNTLYELSKDGSGWTLSTLHTFGDDDGVALTGELLLDRSGNLYGTAEFGGSESCGVVYEFSSAQVFSVLHNFCTSPDSADGSRPTGALVMDGAGALYGTTYEGGDNGQGSIFKLIPGGDFETLYSFCALADCADGANPYLAGLIMDKAGNLFGTAQDGGDNNFGTAFELTSGGEEIVLHSFANDDGIYPSAPLIFDKAGNLFGTTSSAFGGTIFELKKNRV